MKPAPFQYFAPQSLDEALDLLAEHGSDAKPLAGGQSLIPAMNFRLAHPAVLVDLNRIPELQYIDDTARPFESRATEKIFRIGGMTRHRTVELSSVVATHAPLVTKAMPFVAHPAIRTRGTIGGSLAHADPAAELPAVMLALGATIVTSSRTGTRQIAASDFFVGLFTTALEPGEIVTEVRIPLQPSRTGVAFDEVSRRHGDFALAGVAATVTVNESGRCSRANVALLSVADKPVIAATIARHLEGQVPSAEAIRAASEAAAAADIDPTSDIHASSRYRRQLAAVLTRRVLERAFSSVESV